MTIDIYRLIESQNKAREFVSNHSKGSGGVGFGDIESPPLIEETIEIFGKPRLVQTEMGLKKVTKKVRVVRLASGELKVIDGGLNSSISEKDARDILPSNLRKKLAESLAS